MPVYASKLNTFHSVTQLSTELSTLLHKHLKLFLLLLLKSDVTDFTLLSVTPQIGSHSMCIITFQY
jgi:hypothetical protein